MRIQLWAKHMGKIIIPLTTLSIVHFLNYFVGAPIVFERRSHIDGNIMGENKARKQKNSPTIPNTKR
jgi:hypothetical protein